MHRNIPWLSPTQLLWTGIPSVALGAIASAAAQQQCAATDACSPLWFPIRFVIYSAIPFVPIAGTMIAFKAIQKEASRDATETESLRHREDWLRHRQAPNFVYWEQKIEKYIAIDYSCYVNALNALFHEITAQLMLTIFNANRNKFAAKYSNATNAK